MKKHIFIIILLSLFCFLYLLINMKTNTIKITGYISINPPYYSEVNFGVFIFDTYSKQHWYEKSIDANDFRVLNANNHTIIYLQSYESEDKIYLYKDNEITEIFSSQNIRYFDCSDENLYVLADDILIQCNIYSKQQSILTHEVKWFSLADKEILIANTKNKIGIYSLPDLSCIHNILLYNIVDVKSLKLSPDGKFLALINGKTLYVYNTKNSSLYTEIQNICFKELSFSPNSKYIAYVKKSNNIIEFFKTGIINAYSINAYDLYSNNEYIMLESLQRISCLYWS